MKHRILIIGSPGSGKSTLAYQLHLKYQLPLYHIDQIQWLNNKDIITFGELKQKLEYILVKDEWIIDGNYSSTLSMRLKYATTVRWIKEPRVKCIYRVIKRYIYSLLKKENIGGNPKTLSFEFIKYIWDFPKNNDQFIKQQMEGSKQNVHWIIDDSKTLSLLFLQEI